MERRAHKPQIIASVLAVFGLMAAPAAYGRVEASAKGSVRWVEPKIDMGTFDEESGPRTVTFKMVNDGDEYVQIVSANATCGCTKPEFATSPVAPGDTASLTVSYNPAGRPGHFSKKVYVQTTGEPSRSTLTIYGTVIGAKSTLASRFPVEMGPLRLKHGALPLGTLKEDEMKSSYIVVYNASDKPITPTVSTPWHGMTVNFVPRTLPPGEQGVLSATLRGGDAPQYGFSSVPLTVIPDKGEAEHQVSLTVDVQQDFSKLSPEALANAPVAAITPTKVDFGSLGNIADIKPLHLKIANNGRSDLKVMRIYADDTAIVIAAPTDKGNKKNKEKNKGKATTDTVVIKPGKSASWSVTLDPASLKGRELVNGNITIITNDPANPVATLRAVAELPLP